MNIRNHTLMAILLACTAALPLRSHAQWEIEESHTTASLRGIHNVGAGVAWASGTNGTVLRTEDGGYLWQTCSMPPGAEKLDFRGIQAFDENTAIVMSSGPGDQSRLYKTTDGCQTWKLLFTNPDKDGFWDAIIATDEDSYLVLGDSVADKEIIWTIGDNDDPEENKIAAEVGGVKAEPHESSFAASNSVFVAATAERVDPVWEYRWWWATSTADGAFVHILRAESELKAPSCEPCLLEAQRVTAPMAQGVASAGIFSLAFSRNKVGAAVGGDYTKPESATKTAVRTEDSGKTWLPAQTPPHGYRSAVAYDATTQTWITVGPNGTDISTDDGRNWRPLTPTSLDEKDADKNWNALSLPFVVGPKGRIGKLRADLGASIVHK